MTSRPTINIRITAVIILLIIPTVLTGQVRRGRIVSRTTNQPIGYVNIGIVGKNKGTVADRSGNFVLNFKDYNDNDTLRFSMIGYEPKSYRMGEFMKDTVTVVFLKPKIYDLEEVTVIYRRAGRQREIQLGWPVTSNFLKSGFADNDLGSELAIKVHTRHKVRLEDINFNVATCTYDSVTYRLNVYREVGKELYKNILTTPVYLSFTKEDINQVLTFDLRKYSIIIEGSVLIALELYRDLGEGKLLFQTEFFTGTTYHRKNTESPWIKAPGVIGMYAHGLVIR